LRIARTSASETDVHIPEVYNEYCSEQILVMEYVRGKKSEISIQVAKMLKVSQNRDSTP
jgi:predicted unusual protein kinase regulating ubiquinone biosynthesis (AarF/ABC1/UbiB family)